MIPKTLSDAIKSVTVIVGHYGAGKTNLSINLASDLAAANWDVTIIDLDIVNPYFRASEQRSLLECKGVNLIAPIFSEAGTSLDVPSLSGQIAPAIERANSEHIVIIDAGGDDVGAKALGRFASQVREHNYAMFYVANRFRNLVQNPAEALQNLQEIEKSSCLKVTGIINNSHLKQATTPAEIVQGIVYAYEFVHLSNLPLVCTTVPHDVTIPNSQMYYLVKSYVKTPWE